MDDWELTRPENPDESSRHDLFSSVVQQAQNSLLTVRETLLQQRPKSPTSKSPSSWHHSLFSNFCADSAEKLSLQLHKLHHDIFVLAFDECSALNSLNDSSDPPTPNYAPSTYMSLIALLRIIKAQDSFIYYGVKFWYPLLDTTSNMFVPLPSGRKAPSFRLTDSLRPLPPWLYLGFNQMVPTNYVISTMKASQFLTLERLKVFGRPVGTCLVSMA
jgi:hypothetical protein